MNREDIIRMAREAGILEPIELLESNQWRQDTIRELERFFQAAYAAGAAAENEACAKVCERWGKNIRVETWDMAGADCAAAIRARGNT